MPSVLRQLQAEWNGMVPAAQDRGIRRVRILGGGDVERAPLETIAYRRAKVEWLRALLGGTAITQVDGQPVHPFETLTFGVELECFLPRGYGLSQAASAVQAAGVACRSEGYGHSVPTGSWKVVTDGSLGYDRGAEFVSPPLRGEEGFRQLKIVCDTLTRIGAKVTVRCGLHVHVGVRDESPDFFKNLVTLYSSAQQAIDTFMPPSRRGTQNTYCQPLHPNRASMQDAHDLRGVVRAVGQSTDPRSRSRYCKLNLQSYFAYSTVEFRHHGGTVDAVKAANWVRLCLRMVLTAKAGEHQVSSVEELMDAVGADQAEREYFRGRVTYFNRGSSADRFTTYGDQTHARGGHVLQGGR